jgi:hypothetical protein
MKRKKPAEHKSAYHEAAHAVVCLTLGQTFKCIRLRLEARPAPRWNPEARAESRGQFVPTDETIYQSGAATEALINLAGIVFEKTWHPRKTWLQVHLEQDTDARIAAKMCRYYITGDLSNGNGITRAQQIECSSLQQRLTREAGKIIRERWDDIERVGTVLAERGELTQIQVEGIIGAAHKTADSVDR